MEKYIDLLKADLLEYINENYEEIPEDLDEFRETLYDEVWASDDITGNGPDGYPLEVEELKELVKDNISLVIEALTEFDTPAEEIGRRFIAEDWKYLDATARCYCLGWGIDEAIEEIKKEA